MIFLSYNHNDSELVQEIAVKIASVFGKDNVFFDSWSIKPGDGIIEMMNVGLENATHFFFFMSVNSLTSEMVKLEWQNALMLKAHKKIRFIPVKLDDCNVPIILLQNLYINLYGVGLEVALSQMIDVVSGVSQKISMVGYQNVRSKAKFSDDKKKLNITIYVETYFEPAAKFLVLVSNKKDEVKLKTLSESMHMGGFHENVTLNNGVTKNAFSIAIQRGLSKGFPLRMELTSESVIELYSCMRAIDENNFTQIPLEIE